MPARPHSRPVNEQDLRLKVGAYDEQHHAHGYAWKKEKHHWYWFAGIAVTVILTVAAGSAYALYDRAVAPLCSRGDSEVLPSPDGTRVLESVMVSCAGGTPMRRVLIYAAGASYHVPAVASFDEAAVVRIRWVSDDEVALTKSGGRVWDFRPHWHDVKVRYVAR